MKNSILHPGDLGFKTIPYTKENWNTYLLGSMVSEASSMTPLSGSEVLFIQQQ
jgi:hypothetical protein